MAAPSGAKVALHPRMGALSAETEADLREEVDDAVCFLLESSDKSFTNGVNALVSTRVPAVVFHAHICVAGQRLQHKQQQWWSTLVSAQDVCNRFEQQHAAVTAIARPFLNTHTTFPSLPLSFSSTPSQLQHQHQHHDDHSTITLDLSP
eukprot:1075036-Rhodomonas_salina.1